MRRPVAVLAAALLCAACGQGPVQPTAAGDLVPAADRLDAPALEGELLDGAAFDPRTTDGQVVVVNFWGSWCGPCRVEVPELAGLAAELGDDGVRFVGVDVRESPQFARAFLTDRAIDFPSISDPRGEVAAAFADFPVERTPSTVVLDTDGRVAAVYAGPISARDLRSALDALLTEG